MLLRRIFVLIMENLQSTIEAAWNDRALLANSKTLDAINLVIELLDKGKLRCAEPQGDNWIVNDWVKRRSFYIFLLVKWKLLK